MNVLVIPEDFRKDQFILQPIISAMFTIMTLAALRGLQDGPGGGRKTLGLEAARKYRRIYSRCREDVQVLEKRLANWLNEQVVMSYEEAFKTL